MHQAINPADRKTGPPRSSPHRKGRYAVRRIDSLGFSNPVFYPNFVKIEKRSNRGEISNKMEQLIVDGQMWAEQQFGQAQLGDQRRTKRIVKSASRMVKKPQASIPDQMQTWKDTKPFYEVLKKRAVTHAELMKPHWQNTREQAGDPEVVLIVQDGSQIDYTGHQIEGLGPIGDGRGYGYLVHSALAFEPDTKAVLGLMYQKPFVRSEIRHTTQEDSYSRAKRPRESQVWRETVEAIGAPPEQTRWVHVGDSGADIFEFMAACQREGCDFLIRACQDRCVTPADEEAVTYLKTYARTLPAQDHKVIELKGCDNRMRQAQMQISFDEVQIKPPFHSRQQAPLTAYVIRVWEEHAPAEQNPVEWILVTSVPTRDRSTAQRHITWYEHRWVIEDYYQCLKTGCQIEARRLRQGKRLIGLLGIVGVIAVRLLQLRAWARQTPDIPAAQRLPADLLAVVAHLARRPPNQLSTGEFWTTVAQQGGYLARHGDGPPGWKTIWRGWSEIQTLLDGVHLASELSS